MSSTIRAGSWWVIGMSAMFVAGCGRIGFDAIDGEDVVIGEPRTCRDIHLLGLPTGVHTLDPDRDGPSVPRDVWCEQERRGGGWTLALKIDGAQSTFRGTNDVWDDATLLNPTSLNPLALDQAKLAPYLDEPLAELMLVVEGGGDVVLRMRGSSLRALIASGLTFPTATPELEWRAAFADPSLQVGCRRQGVGLTNQPSTENGRNKCFVAAYRAARIAWLAGIPTVFPPGTYWLHRFAGVPIATAA